MIYTFSKCKVCHTAQLYDTCQYICALYVIMLKNIEGHYTIHAPQHTMYILKYNQHFCICKQFSKILFASYITSTSVPLVSHWCWIGEHFCKHLSQTLCALHTSHCTLLASLLQNPVCSSNRSHFSYATLPFTILTEVLPERGTRMLSLIHI